MTRDYYAVLEVGVGATSTQIRRAYQRLARRYSPDVNSLGAQYPVALRGDRRSLSRAERSDHAAPSMTAARVGRSSRDMSAPPDIQRPGAGARIPVSRWSCPFAQAATGMSAEVLVDRQSPCETCAATGGRAGAQPAPCDHCGGTGAVWRDTGAITAEACPACRRSRPACERALSRLPRTRGACRESHRARIDSRRSGHRRPDPCARRGPCGSFWRASRRSHGDCARA